MINATSPAAKISPMHTDAISASDTSTSALMSNAVTSPMIASSTIGTPHRTIASQAGSNAPKRTPHRLQMTATPEIASSVTSFRMPPSFCSASSLSIHFFIISLFPDTIWGMCIQYS